MKVYLIYGPQGSGKSTQAKLLAEKLGLILVSTGQISRDIASKNEIVRKLIDNGEPTPQEFIVPAVEEVLEKSKNGKGFVFDGYPRYAQQIESLVVSIENHGWEINKVFVIDLSIDEGIKRIMSRSKIESRADDTPEGIARRLELYKQQTIPIIDYFKTLGKVIEIDGSGTIKQVHQLIINALENNG